MQHGDAPLLNCVSLFCLVRLGVDRSSNFGEDVDERAINASVYSIEMPRHIPLP